MTTSRLLNLARITIFHGEINQQRSNRNSVRVVQFGGVVVISWTVDAHSIQA